MARSHRRLATIAATGTLAGLATLAAAGSASAATADAHAGGTGTTGNVCIVTGVTSPIILQSDTCAVVVVHNPGLVTQLLNDLL